jgi:hypothetical protein
VVRKKRRIAMSHVAFEEIVNTVENTKTEPSLNGDNGRGMDGRFAKGNPGGPGNPFARQVAALRRVLLEAVSANDLRDIVNALVAQARCGHVAAAKIVLEYTLGKPAKTVEPDHLDIEEWQHFKATAPMMREGAKLSATLNPEFPLTLVRSAREANTRTQHQRTEGLSPADVPTYLRELRSNRKGW